LILSLVLYFDVAENGFWLLIVTVSWILSIYKCHCGCDSTFGIWICKYYFLIFFLSVIRCECSFIPMLARIRILQNYSRASVMHMKWAIAIQLFLIYGNNFCSQGFNFIFLRQGKVLYFLIGTLLLHSAVLLVPQHSSAETKKTE